MSHMCVTVLSLIAVSLSGAGLSDKGALESSDETVDMGVFKVGQSKECSVSIRNATSEDVTIDRVISNCACFRVKMDALVIRPGSSVPLRIATLRQFPGKFQSSVIVVPKDTDKHDSLKINVRGEVKSSVSTQVGWSGGILQRPISANACQLGIRHRSSADLIVCVEPLGKAAGGRGFVVDANSLHFRIEDINEAPTDCSGGDGEKVKSPPRLILTFKPKKPLPVGRLRDFLEISFRDESKLYIPIECRIVGDVYLEQEIIHLGKLKVCPTANLRILFANDAKRWHDVRWKGAGLLQTALDIQKTESSQAHEVPLAMSLNRKRLTTLPQGYLLCRLTLYEGQATDQNAVTVLVDGFN